jgi:branched-chain amino acid transport system permease protein
MNNWHIEFMFTYLIILGVLDGCKLFFIAVALSIQFRLMKSLDFSLAVAFSLGGYIAFEVSELNYIPLWFIPFIVAPLVIVFGLILDSAVFQPLEYSKASLLVFMTTSLGILFASSGIFQIIWGTEILSILSGPAATVDILGSPVTNVQLKALLLHLFGICLLWGVLKFSKIGQQVRAAGENLNLIRALGFNIKKIRGISILLTYGAIGSAGAISAIEYGATYTSGLPVFLTAAVVMIVGGGIHIGSIFAAALGLGLIRCVSLAFIGDQWQQTITFSLLIIYTLYSLSKIRYPDILKK